MEDVAVVWFMLAVCVIAILVIAVDCARTAWREARSRRNTPVITSDIQVDPRAHQGGES